MPKLSALGDVVASYDPKPGLHYKLSCYVCGRSCTKPSPFEGWATFERIFQQRPDGCRFAVAQQLVIVSLADKISHKVDEDWLCWDLFDDRLVNIRPETRGYLRAPRPLWTSPSESGLIMKAMMLYDR